MNTLLLRINTTNTPADELPKAHALISANARDTDKVKVPPEQRYRNVLIPELSLPSVEDKFRAVLLDKLYSLASERFTGLMQETKRMATTLNADDYTVAGLLAYYATDASNGRMTAESIKDWFKDSTTAAFILNAATKKVGTAGAPGIVEGYAINYAKLASPNHGLNPNTCTALLAILQPEDLKHPIPVALASKLQATINKATVSAVAALI